MKEILFLSHNIRHQRCTYLANDLNKEYKVIIPHLALELSSRLSVSSKSASNMLHLGISALRTRTPIHLDGIDVFIQPFLIGSEYLHDYHVPLVPELKWMGVNGLAAYAHRVLPSSLGKAKVVITPNRRMLRHALEYACFEEYYVVPNYPPKTFLTKMGQAEARNHLSLPDGREIALFVGGARLREIYGIDLLIRSWFEVKRNNPDALLYVLGPSFQLGYNTDVFSLLERRGIVFPGLVEHNDIPKWIAAADLCMSQRTPGFPSDFYDIHDSIKLSEYALFEKPIVAAGYMPGKDYVHAETNVDSYSRAIQSGLNGEAPKPTPHTWEENLPTIRKAYAALMDG